MTDSMNFGPEWLRNLSSEGTTTGGTRYQLAEHRYGREEMLALFDKSLPAPESLSLFPPLYSEIVLPPLALLPVNEEERQWSSRGPSVGTATRGGRGAANSGERGGRSARGGRGGYQPLFRGIGYESGGGWGGVGNEQTDWNARKDFSYNRSVENWRRTSRGDEDDGWRSSHHPGRGGGSIGSSEGGKWGRSSSWREGDDERPVEKRAWPEGSQRQPRRLWEHEDHLPEWATENLGEGGGTFDSSGAFHGSDEELEARREASLLQKSASQQNIKPSSHPPLATSKSALQLNKPPEAKKVIHDVDVGIISSARESPAKLEMSKSFDNMTDKVPKACPTDAIDKIHHAKEDHLADAKVDDVRANKMEEKQVLQMPSQLSESSGSRVAVEEDFEKLQEDFVSKLVVEEEVPAPTQSNPSVHLVNGITPPAAALLAQDKWFYQDPQGDLQGPFASAEMAEWYKAGYFSMSLLVRRHFDDSFYSLGELVSLCKGNPFQSSIKLPVKLPEEMAGYQQQLLQAQLGMRARSFGQGEPWNALGGAPPMMMPLPQMPPDSFLPPTNPMIHHVLSQMQQQQQQQKIPPMGAPLLDEPRALDPLQALVQQMGGLQNMQARLPQQPQPPTGAPPPSQPNNPLKHEAVHGGLPVNGTVMPLVLPQSVASLPKTAGKMEMDNNLLQFMQHSKRPMPLEQSIDMDTLWQRNSHGAPMVQQQQLQQQAPPVQTTNQWQNSVDKPISMWDLPVTSPSPLLADSKTSLTDAIIGGPTNDARMVKEDPGVVSKKDLKRVKELREQEEKMVKKELEEKRKNEQKKQEADKKLEAEKRRKDEERIKKELDKAKKEADEKRMAEKKKLKEQRKAEEEARKKTETLKKMQEEKERMAAKEREEQQRKQAEFIRQQQLANNQQKMLNKAAPWSPPSSTHGLSLAEIQKREREMKSEMLLIQQQQQQQRAQLMQQQEQISPEKTAGGITLNWANKPIKQNHVKSLAEIQAEEQEKMLKLKANEKAMQQQKEKESLSAPNSGIWSGQSLTWTNNTGFWDDPAPPQQVPQKNSQQVNKNVQQQQQQQQKVANAAATTNNKQQSAAVNKQPQQQQQQQNKQPTKQQQQQKKEEHSNNNSNTKNTNSVDEFAEWCTTTLANMNINMNTQVDIPTFVSFLKDIESALDVRDYCREYLGDKPATQKFATQFLEKRRLFKPKVTAHKDDMCSPAPAITPSTQHSNNDFQEVKGKGKKCKKSKMLKVDARILGFNVTAAQDRINVGDRDYGDTT